MASWNVLLLQGQPTWSSGAARSTRTHASQALAAGKLGVAHALRVKAGLGAHARGRRRAHPELESQGSC